MDDGSLAGVGCSHQQDRFVLFHSVHLKRPGVLPNSYGIKNATIESCRVDFGAESRQRNSVQAGFFHIADPLTFLH